MTEFEAATIAFQEATVAFQEASIVLQEANIALRAENLTVVKWQVAATLAIGLGQIAVVWFGIRAMQRAGERRAVEQDQRHDETMLALRALIDGQRDDRAALAALIDRTAPTTTRGAQ